MPMTLSTEIFYTGINPYTMQPVFTARTERDKQAQRQFFFWYSSSHNTWKGHAFERVCLQHVNQIKAALGISGVQTNVCSWFVRGTKERQGAQIDLVMQRADGFTDICEMKHSVNTFSRDNDYAKDLQNKLDAYRELSKDKRTLHLVLITTNGVVHNNYYNMVQKEINMDELFT